MRAFWLMTTALTLACGGASAPEVPVTAAPVPDVASQPAPEVARPWAVQWERTIGWLSTEPVFVGEDVLSGGARFDSAGRFGGMTPAHVGGGRMIATVHAVLADGRALVSGSGADNQPALMVVGLDRPPEQAAASAAVYVDKVAVGGSRVAVHTGREVVLLALPDLRVVERFAVSEKRSITAAVAVAGESVIFTACADAACKDVNLVARDAAGDTAVLAPRPGQVAFAPTGDVAALRRGDGTVTVIALPGGDVLARGQSARGGGPLAVAPGGRAVAAVSCGQVQVLDRDGDQLRAGFRGRLRDHGVGKGDCPYVDGVAFDRAGRTLAVSSRQLTVLARREPEAQRPVPGYRPVLPDGWVARSDNPAFMGFPDGSGLARAPREIAVYEHDEDDAWASVSVVVRDADQLRAAGSLDAWARALWLRFEPMMRGDEDPNQLEDYGAEVVPYRRAFVDEHGRRTLEYGVWQRDGCEPHDRHVRFVEDGDDLVQITMTTEVGLDPGLAAPWLEAFFDAPLGRSAGRVLAQKFTRPGGC